MRKVRSVVVIGLVAAAAITPSIAATGEDTNDDTIVNQAGQTWWATGQGAGSANFQPDADMFAVCDESSDGVEVVGVVYDHDDVVYTIVADGGSGDCERRVANRGDRYDLRERAKYDFKVCVTEVDDCVIRSLRA